MLVGVCWVAVYDTAEADMSSSPLSVALLSPTVKEEAHKRADTCRDIKEKYPKKKLKLHSTFCQKCENMNSFPY